MTRFDRLFTRVHLPAWMAGFVAAALIATGCDSSEDPFLLNPPPPDSSAVRVVNLINSEPIDVGIGAQTVWTALAPMSISVRRNFLFSEPVNLTVRRPSRPDTLDILPAQQFRGGSPTTYYVIGSENRTIVLSRSSSQIDRDDLAARGMSRLVFINAVADSTSYVLRMNCPSGDSLFRRGLLGELQTLQVAERDLSLFLVDATTNEAVASARLELQAGSVATLVAARSRTGRVALYLIDEHASMLAEAPAETRTDATIEVLNTTSDPIDVELGSEAIASALAPLALSPATTVSACGLSTGDSLVVSSNGGRLDTSIALSVGSRNLLVLYEQGGRTRALVVPRKTDGAAPNAASVRAVNLAGDRGRLFVEAGAGAPGIGLRNERLFGGLELGRPSGYRDLPIGTYPLLLRDSETGQAVGGSVGELVNGRYTFLVVDDGSGLKLLFTRDDDGNAGVAEFGEPGAQVLFFNVMPDAEATFTAGGLQLPPIAYSYVIQTLVAKSVTSITSSAGEIAIDLSNGGYTVGTTGSGSSRSTIAFPSPNTEPPIGRASIRFVNAVPGSSAMDIHQGDSATPVIGTTRFGEPTQAIERDALKYSFVATISGRTDVLARATGLEVSGRRHYLYVIAPRRTPGSPVHSVLWLQE